MAPDALGDRGPGDDGDDLQAARPVGALEDVDRKRSWDFGPDVERIYRQAVERRYRLLPYIYTLFRDAARNGAPIMRPVFFAAPDQARLRREDRAFLLGPDLLIVPQWPAGGPRRRRSARAAGRLRHEITLVGERPDVDTALPRIRIRTGAIVPAGVVVQTTAWDPSSALDLYVALGTDGTASGTLYEDDGEGLAYLDGEYRQVTLRAATVNGKVIVTLERQEGAMALPVRVIRAHLYRRDGVTTSQGMTDRVELDLPDP